MHNTSCSMQIPCKLLYMECTFYMYNAADSPVWAAGPETWVRFLKDHPKGWYRPHVALCTPEISIECTEFICLRAIIVTVHTGSWSLLVSSHCWGEEGVWSKPSVFLGTYSHCFQKLDRWFFLSGGDCRLTLSCSSRIRVCIKREGDKGGQKMTATE